MANVLYDKGREAFATGGINWTGDTIKLVLCTSGYTADTSTHQYLSDVTAGARVATSGAFTTKTATAGVCDADDVTISSVASGSTVTQIVIYQDTGTESTSRLIALIDTATNLPFTTNGGSVTVQWDNGSNKIFKL